jgi:hypothetical protein
LVVSVAVVAVWVVVIVVAGAAVERRKAQERLQLRPPSLRVALRLLLLPSLPCASVLLVSLHAVSVRRRCTRLSLRLLLLRGAFATPTSTT